MQVVMALLLVLTIVVVLETLRRKIEKENNDKIRIAKAEEQKEALEKWRVLREELNSRILNRAKELIEIHIQVLALKWSQTVVQDPYGNWNYERWHPENLYFVKKVLLRDEHLNELWKMYTAPDDSEDDLTITVFSLEVMSVIEEAISKYRIANTASQDVDFDVDSLTPSEFEIYCSEYLKACGWTTRLTAATGDQGIDIVANIGNIKAVFQCKKYSQPVGNAAVQEIIAGQRFEQADIAAVVTNSTYTQSAKQLANATDVHLLHHTELFGFAEKLGVTTSLAQSINPSTN